MELGGLKGVFLDPREEIRAALDYHGVQLLESVGSDHEWDLVISIGWNQMCSYASDAHLVSHDSLLPALRGWNPSVTAIEAGLSETGLTIFRATKQVDGGPVLWSKSIPITRQETIGSLLDGLAVIASEGVNAIFAQKLFLSKGVAQDDDQASFSLWRDDLDYKIDWSRDAETIDRFVRSRSFPYAGAKTCAEGETLNVWKGSVLARRGPRIVNRSAGKIFNKDSEGVTVVCGDGLYRIEDITDGSGDQYLFSKLRLRLT